MRLITSATAKKLLDLEVGELCHVKLGSYGLGWVIMLAVGDDSKRETAILQVGNDLLPRHHVLDSFDGICLSYGKDWVLSVDNDGIEPKAADNREIPGAIYHFAGTSAMYLAPFSSSHLQGYGLSLPSLSKVEIPNDSVAVLRWKIWATEDDRDFGCEPLLQFG